MPSSRLFAYGTLVAREILEHVLGRELPGASASVQGFACYRVRDEHFPGATPEPGASTAGVLYEGASAEDLEHLDHYETALYQRLVVPVQLPDGNVRDAWLYAIRAEHRHLLSRERWDLDGFLAEGVEPFLASMKGGVE